MNLDLECHVSLLCWCACPCRSPDTVENYTDLSQPPGNSIIWNVRYISLIPDINLVTF